MSRTSIVSSCPSSRDTCISSDAPAGGNFLVEAALAELLPPDESAADVTILRHVRLTTAQARTLAQSQERFANSNELPEQQQTGQPHGVLLSLYRADIPAPPDDSAG